MMYHTGYKKAKYEYVFVKKKTIRVTSMELFFGQENLRNRFNIFSKKQMSMTDKWQFLSLSYSKFDFPCKDR